MNSNKKIIKTTGLIILSSAFLILKTSCNREKLLQPNNNIIFDDRLSSYKIFQGSMRNLIPTDSFHFYEIATPLYSDGAEKQRLLKLPPGTMMNANDDNLPNFPDGTMLVKTFFYYHDQRDTGKGKQIVETRIQLKINSKWNLATYLWNDDQTEATLVRDGANRPVNRIDENGFTQSINFHIPSSQECATCHYKEGEVTPIGFKMRNINMNVLRDNVQINQLEFFQRMGLFSALNSADYSKLPNWKEINLPLEKSARAYLDMNCAHCHNPQGFAKRTHIYFGYEIPFAQTKIKEVKNAIPVLMENRIMPKLGVTVVDQKGLALIRQYIRTL